jgi:hypothetical protein
MDTQYLLVHVQEQQILSSYNSSVCAGQSWLYGNGYEWTIVPNSSNSSYVWFVMIPALRVTITRENGGVGSPVLYLKSNVKKYGGDGSKNNPYIINV